jgi:hypothetical protein
MRVADHALGEAPGEVVKLDPKLELAMDVLAVRGVARASTGTSHELHGHDLPSVRGNEASVLRLLGLAERTESGRCVVLTYMGWKWVHTHRRKAARSL